MMGSRCGGTLGCFLWAIFSLYNYGKNKRHGIERHGVHLKLQRCGNLETKKQSQFRFSRISKCTYHFQKFAGTFDMVFVMVSFYSEAELMHILDKSLEFHIMFWETNRKEWISLFHYIKRMLLYKTWPFSQRPKAGTKNFHFTKCWGFILDIMVFLKMILDFWHCPPWCRVPATCHQFYLYTFILWNHYCMHASPCKVGNP